MLKLNPIWPKWRPNQTKIKIWNWPRQDQRSLSCFILSWQSKIAKNLTFFQKKLTKNYFFKMSSFWHFFDIQMTIVRRVRSTVRQEYEGKSDFGKKWVRLAPYGKTPGYFQIKFQYISRVSCYNRVTVKFWRQFFLAEDSQKPYPGIPL